MIIGILKLLIMAEVVRSISDYEFWNNNPAKFIYLQMECGMDCSGSIHRFDNASIDQRLFFFAGPKISISNQNDRILIRFSFRYAN